MRQERKELTQIYLFDTDASICGSIKETERLEANVTFDTYRAGMAVTVVYSS